jgi:hypothetical protein
VIFPGILRLTDWPLRGTAPLLRITCLAALDTIPWPLRGTEPMARGSFLAQAKLMA